MTTRQYNVMESGGNPNVVSPQGSRKQQKKGNDDDDSQEYDEMFFLKEVLKAPGSVVPKNLTGSGAEINIEGLRGGLLDVLYVNQGENDGFAWPLVDILTRSPAPDDHTGRVKRERLVEQTNIVSVCSRRKSVSVNLPELKKDKVGGTDRFRKVCFIVYWGPGKPSCRENRRRVVRAVANFLNEYQNNYPGRLQQTPKKDRYFVPLDFDRTPLDEDKRVRLDHKILDQEVKMVLEQIWKGPVPKSFASSYPLLADMLFSKPYCALARTHLGYSCVTQAMANHQH